MRIIAGTAKGTRLAPVPPGVRPLSDRAREGLFASLGERVIEARALDLFAGTGAIGIEALSRGAASCTFVDGVSPRVGRRSERTCGAAAVVIERRSSPRDVLAFLRRHRAERGPWDLAFLDRRTRPDRPTSTMS